VDLFCGTGGLSHGFKLQGFPLAAGIDVDEACSFPYEENNGAPFIRKDVAELKAAEVERLFTLGKVRVLVGCTACQPFSVYNQKNDDPKWRLLNSFGNLIKQVRPDVLHFALRRGFRRIPSPAASRRLLFPILVPQAPTSCLFPLRKKSTHRIAQLESISVSIVPNVPKIASSRRIGCCVSVCTAWARTGTAP
jgi:hypothetical protein